MPNRLIDGRDNPIDRKGLYRPIVGALVTVLVSFIFYRLGDDPWLDQVSTFIILFSLIQSALVVLTFTEDWLWRTVGVLIALGGVGLAYTIFFGFTVSHAELNALAVRSVLRASLDVGGVILVVSTWAYLYNRRRGIGLNTDLFDTRDGYRDRKG